MLQKSGYPRNRALVEALRARGGEGKRDTGDGGWRASHGCLTSAREADKDCFMLYRFTFKPRPILIHPSKVVHGSKEGNS
jgi:hypothetical protein